LGFSYSVFGLLLHSNLAFSGVPATHPSGVPSDVEVHLGVPPYHSAHQLPIAEELTYLSPYTDARGEPGLRIWKSAGGGFLRLSYSDGTQFWLDSSRRHVWVTWPDELSLDSALSYLLGPVFGLLLRLRGVTCLHASAVAFEDRSIIFVGSAGAGKSTTAAAFAQMGYAVLSDDIVALSSSVSGASSKTELAETTAASQPPAFHAFPAYPHLCLWPDSVKMIYGSAAALPPLSPDWEKCRLSLGTASARFETRTLPIGAIYIFKERRRDSAPYVEPAMGQTALLSLLANTYANNLLDREMRAQEFAILGRLVGSVPIRFLTPHEDPARIEELCACVRHDFRSLERPVAGKFSALEGKA
jgi:hypothetical protein